MFTTNLTTEDHAYRRVNNKVNHHAHAQSTTFDLNVSKLFFFSTVPDNVLLKHSNNDEFKPRL
jgi:hypothetical protein